MMKTNFKKQFIAGLLAISSLTGFGSSIEAAGTSYNPDIELSFCGQTLVNVPSALTHQLSSLALSSNDNLMQDWVQIESKQKSLTLETVLCAERSVSCYESSANTITSDVAKAVGNAAGFSASNYELDTKFGNVNGIPAGNVSVYNNNGKKILIVSFHGTACTDDGITDAYATKTKCDFLGNHSAHTGFVKRYMLVRDDLMQTLKVLSRCQYNFSEILITGHSLGGALATLCTLDLANRINKNEFGKEWYNKFGSHLLEKSNLYSITLCSPRVLSKNAAKYAENLIPESTGNIMRLWRNGDAVPAVGTGWMGFKHFGRSCMVTHKYSTLAAHSSVNMLKDVINFATTPNAFKQGIAKDTKGAARKSWFRSLFGRN